MPPKKLTKKRPAQRQSSSSAIADDDPRLQNRPIDDKEAEAASGRVNGREKCIPDNILLATSIKSKKIQTFMNAIRTVGGTSNLMVVGTKQGVRFIFEESQSFQSSVFFKVPFYDTYKTTFPEGVQSVSFAVDLRGFMDSMNTFMDNRHSTLLMTYYGEGAPLSFVLLQKDITLPLMDFDSSQYAEQMIRTEYSLKIKHPFDTLDRTIISPAICSQITMTGYNCFTTINSFDRVTEALKISVSADDIKIKALGDLNVATVALFTFDCDYIKKFDFIERSLHSYSFKYFRWMLKTFKFSQEVVLETQKDGHMRIQVGIASKDKDQEEDAHECYGEFFLSPNVEESDTEEIVVRRFNDFNGFSDDG